MWQKGRKMVKGRDVEGRASQKRELERYFISSMVFYFFFSAVFLAVIALLGYVSNLVYGNPLINYALYGETRGKILFSTILIVSIVGAFVYGLIKHRRRIFLKTPPYVNKKLNAILNIGFVWIFLSGFYFITHFSSFLSDFGTYTSFSLFNGYTYYLTGDSSFALNYCTVFPMMQGELENWAIYLHWIILPLFVASLLMLMGVLIYVKYKK